MAKQIGKYSDINYLYDASIYTEDGWCFPVHKIILSLKSEYFWVLFGIENDRTPQNFFIPGIGGQVMKLVLDFIYEKEVVLNEKTIPDCILAFDYLLVDDLLGRCWKYAVYSTSASNCIRLYVVAKMLNKVYLIKFFKHFISFNFEKIVDCDESDLHELPFDLLEDILLENNLRISDQKFVWKAICPWVDKGMEERILLICQLMKRLNLNFPDSCVSHLINSNKVCFMTAEDIWQVLSTHYSGDLSFYHRPPQKMIIFIKHINSDNIPEKISINITFDETLYHWREINIKFNYWPNKIVVLREKVYLFNTWTSENLSLDLITKEWTKLPESLHNRTYHTIVHLEEEIYAIGGRLNTTIEDRDLSTTAAEKYDPKLNRWREIAPTKCKRVEAVSTGGLIYVFGNHLLEDNEPVLLMEVYDAFTDSWIQIIPPILPRRNFAAIVFKKRIFIIGGTHDDIGIVKSVDVFDPCSQMWETFQELPFRYQYPQAIVFEESLVVYDELPVYWNETYKDKLPVYWNENKNMWNRFYSSNFKPLDQYLFSFTEDASLIKKMWEEHQKESTKWMECSKKRLSSDKQFI